MTYWSSVQSNDHFEDPGLDMSSDFRKMAGYPQQFSEFPSHNPQIDRIESRSFPGYPNQFLAADTQVLDGNSGRILPSSSRELGMETEPLRRFYNQPEPWNPQGLSAFPSTPRFKTPGQVTVTRSPGPVYGGYREPAKSNPESHFSRHHPDSGYATHQPGPRSIVSGGHEYMGQEDENTSLNQEVHGMQLRPGSDIASVYPEDTQVETGTNAGSWNGDGNPTGSGSITCPFEPCNVDPKPRNQSEYKKHMQRHNKPFVCNLRECARAKKGFTTKNDLDRHRKSVHKILSSNTNDRSWICQGPNCNKKGKIWPRLDNFKSHCNRMHKKEDLDELVKKSEVGSDAVASAQDLHSAQLCMGAKNPSVGGDSTDGAGLLLEMSRSAPVAGSPLLADLNHHQSAYGNTSYPPNVPNFAIDSRLTTEGVDMTSVQRTPGHLQAPSNQSQSLLQDGISSRPATKATKPLPNTEVNAESLQKQRASKAQSAGNPMKELSRQLTSDVTSYLKLDQSNLDQSSIDALKNIIEGRLGEIVGQSSRTHKRSASEAGLDGLSEALRPPKRVYCKTCDKTMTRNCDMKKHEKRHARPWGCTDAECNKSFGSKNDWKRHENSQHYQLEMWRCHEEDSESKIKICAKIFFRRDPFQQHLKKDHQREDMEYVKGQLKQRRIGRAFQNTFWCGFCKEIIQLKALGLEAWDERFNHIDDLHFKKGQNIADWYPMDKDLPKGKLRPQREHPSGRGGLDDHDTDYSSDEEGTSRNEKRNRRRGRMSPPAPPPGPPESSSANGGGNGSRGRLLSGTKSSTEEANQWYCRGCNYGPMNSRMELSCCNCHKPRHG